MAIREVASQEEFYTLRTDEQGTLAPNNVPRNTIVRVMTSGTEYVIQTEDDGNNGKRLTWVPHIASNATTKTAHHYHRPMLRRKDAKQ